MAVVLMSKGEEASLILGPELAYGAAGFNQTVPANARIVCEIALIDITDSF